MTEQPIEQVLAAKENAKAFGRDRRLLAAAEYRFVFERARRVSNPWLTILGRRRLETDSTYRGARLGLAIAKKSVRLAVQRNRIKRLVRESFRSRMNALPDIDVVVLAKPGIDRQSNHDIDQALNTLWGDLKRRFNKAQK